MRWRYIILSFALVGIILCSCASLGSSSPAPSTMEVIKALEVEVNEQDLEGVLALFAEDALWDSSYKNDSMKGIENIDFVLEEYFMTPVTSEFRDISVNGDSATFTWVEFRSGMNKIWPVIMEVQDGKITLIEWPEDAVRESTDIE